jgi:hypothetical protein
MSPEIEPDARRLEESRNSVYSFLRRKKRLSTALFVLAGAFEIGFFVLMLAFMDFSKQLYWFLFFGLCMVYCPLITFAWRNSVRIDQLFYRLVEELKYHHEGSGRDGGSINA